MKHHQTSPYQQWKPAWILSALVSLLCLCIFRGKGFDIRVKKQAASKVVQTAFRVFQLKDRKGRFSLKQPVYNRFILYFENQSLVSIRSAP